MCKFRRHVMRRANESTSGQPCCVGVSGSAYRNTEIDECDAIVTMAIASPHDIARFEVAMDDLGGVSFRKCARDVAGDPQCASRWNRTGLQHPVEWLAIDELHREIRPAVVEFTDGI